MKNLDCIDKLVNDAVSAGEIAGASIRAIHNGRTICSLTYGYADKEKGIKMSEDTIFRLFSMTKPITAAAVMILLEKGLVRYTDPVKKFIPAFSEPVVEDKNGTRPAERDITIRDLLSMTSGLTYPEETPAGRKMGALFYEIKERNFGSSPLTTMEIAERAGKLPLCFSPGESWMYGTSADIAGAVVEAVSGKSFGSFLKDEIFEPLDMYDTGFYIPEEKYSRLAQIYLPTENGLVPFTDFHLGLTDYRKPPAFESGGAGLVSTAEDYGKFALMLAGGGDILGKNTVSLMTKNMLNAKQKEAAHNWDSIKGHGYGCFMRISEDPTVNGNISPAGEFGWDGWTGNYFSVDPVNNFIFLYFIQNCGAGSTELMYRVKNIVYSGLENK